MARLILMFNKQVIKEYPLMKESITIGRQDDNTIVVDNLSVSGYHARIDPTGGDYILTDLQSTNGTFINDKKIVSHKLSHGDNVVIGKHVILFVSGDKEKVPDSAKDSSQMDMNKTMMLDTAKQRELLAKQKSEIQTPKKAEKIGAINFIDGSNLGEIELTKKLTKIGKSDTSEIKLSGILMPATIATISRRPSGYTLTFTGGMTKLKINGETIKDSVQLKDFDTIEIGSFKFQFYEKDPNKK